MLKFQIAFIYSNSKLRPVYLSFKFCALNLNDVDIRLDGSEVVFKPLT